MIRVPWVGVRQPECGYDGTNGWTVDFERRLEPLSSSEAVPFRGLLDKFSPLYFSRDFRLTRTLDIEHFADRDCYRVLVVFPSGEHAFESYDTEDGLLVGADYPFADNGGSFNVRTTWSDYRRLRNGLRVPFRSNLAVFGQHYLLRAKEVRTDEAGFSVPASKCHLGAASSAILKPDPKPAQEIIKNYVEALGGRPRFAPTPPFTSPANCGTRAAMVSPVQSKSSRRCPTASFSRSSSRMASTARDAMAGAFGGRRAQK